MSEQLKEELEKVVAPKVLEDVEDVTEELETKLEEVAEKEEEKSEEEEVIELLEAIQEEGHTITNLEDDAKDAKGANWLLIGGGVVVVLAIGLFSLFMSKDDETEIDQTRENQADNNKPVGF